MLKIVKIWALLGVCFFLAACGSSDPRPYNEEHCADLLAQAEELKGKPQRRATVMQRYDAECTGY